MISDTIIRAAHPGDAGNLARIHVQCWRSTYHGIIRQSYLDQMREEHVTVSMQRGLIDPQNDYLIAEGPQGAVGYICAGPQRSRDPIYRGEIYELYILAAYQQQGLGRQLLSTMARHLYRNNYFSIMVWVLARNPNRRFYEKSNGIYLHTRSITFAGSMLDAAAYGWIDTTLAISGEP